MKFPKETKEMASSACAAIGISAVRYTNESSFYIGEYESFKSMTIEPYVGMREAYIQYRRKQIKE